MPRRRSRSLVLALVCALTAAPAAAAPGAERAVCGWEGYSYAGYRSPVQAYGVAGRLALRARADVRSGHVAAWLGVGGSGFAPGGGDAWVQAGLAGFADGRAELYYEYATPSMRKPRYVAVAPLAARAAHDVAVQERRARPGAWRVLVDGRPVGSPIVLPGSHGAWRPIATAESWDGGVRTCNRFAFDFSDVAVATAPGGRWRPFALTDPIQDPGYRVSPRASGFTARAA